MNDFLLSLFSTTFPFLRNALIAGLLSSIAFGIMGSFVVVRRITSAAGAISHSVLGGIGLAIFAQYHWGWTWLDPILGALLSAIIAALIISLVSSQKKQREDSIISSIWAVGMAIGLLFIAKTPGYIDPMSYLFGNILIVSTRDLWMIAGLDVLVSVLAVLLFHPLQASSFDSEFSAIRGINPRLYHLVLLLLSAVTIVLMTTIVGIVMVIALLTLPAAISSRFTKSLKGMIFLSIFLTALFSTLGIALSYMKDLTSGPVIILIAATTYLFTVIGQKLSRR